jgi:SAM-dependent methyltransferase
MNSGIPDSDSSIHYYDGDYPSKVFGKFPENFDEVVTYQGLVGDVERYLDLATKEGRKILDLCCGTGRVSIPLLRAGHHVTAVDISEGMLTTFREHLRSEAPELRDRADLRQQDVAKLDLEFRQHSFAFMAFNSLPCIPDFDLQLAVLKSAGAHLAPDALLVIDTVNPLKVKIEGNPVPVPFFTRTNPRTGRRYTRFAMSRPIDTKQCQRLYGWYDELTETGQVARREYSVLWRPIFRYELELMLQAAGFRIEAMEGGNQREPFTAQSPKIFALARRL